MQQNSESHELVRMDAAINLEDVAAIKVSEVEVDLIGQADILRQDITKLESDAADLNVKLPEVVTEDTMKSYPELKKLEKALQDFFGSKNVNLSVARLSECGDAKNKVKIQISASDSFAWRGKASKEMSAEIKKKQKEAVEKQDQLVEVRKKLAQLPALERRTKAAVARHRLSQSRDGKALLTQIGKVDIPGLPMPKK